MSIMIQAVSYIHPDRVSLFSAVSCSVLKGQKAALVGDNGAGKSTLLRIVAGQLLPTTGKVFNSDLPYYVPQHTGQFDNYTVGEALGIADRLKALQAILEGDASAANLECLADDWDIEERFCASMSLWGIEHIAVAHPMKQLSGGEKTKVFLAGIYIHSPRVILLDEPSNHLDTAGRKQLYDFIRRSKQTILCVSHDRTLLNQFDIILELSENRIETYGGNYEFYQEEKSKKTEALQRSAEEKEKTIKQTMQHSREMAERRQKLEARGRAGVQKKGLPRIIANSLQSKGEQSSAKSKSIQEEKIRELSDGLKEVRNQIRRQAVLRIDLKSSELHHGKILVEAKGVNFSYGNDPLWRDSLHFVIRSGERVCIAGDNGTGKTTLVKLLMGELSPLSGKLYRTDFRYLYVDQNYSLLDNALTLVEQVQLFNERLLQEHELKMLLHNHNFPKEMWGKKGSQLSGGEKMKLLLCCLSVKDNVPDVIILDEPTNNLDIHSQLILTEAVKGFGGTVILISHDGYFKKEIEVEKSITLC